MELGSPASRIRRDLDHGEDWISKLPNEILALIFPFLPAKEVGRTSILSKRWRYVWTYHPYLEFDDHGIKGPDNVYFRKLEYFNDSVDHALFLHRGSTLKRCSFNCTKFEISPWISAAICCNVQELSVETMFHVQALPPSLFTGRTLVVLKIEGPFQVNLPFRVCLPCLKTLSLRYVKYGDDLTMQRLFSSCPLLEDLDIVRNGWDGVLIASITAPSLKKLQLNQTYLEPVLGYQYKTVIHAPNLKFLALEDSVSKAFDFNFSDALVDAVINGRYGAYILRGTPHVRDLLICGDAFGRLHNAILPVFHNLINLELGVSELGVDWDFLSKLLSNTPNLKTLVFGEGLLLPDDSETPDGLNSFDWDPPESPPACLQLHLKEIKIHKFVGRQCECFLIQYLLDNGLVLDKMTVYWSDSHQVLTKSESEVMSYERSSPGCVVEFLAAMNV